MTPTASGSWPMAAAAMVAPPIKVYSLKKVEFEQACRPFLEDGQAAEQVGDAEEYRLGDERGQQGVEAFLEDHADGEQGCGDPEEYSERNREGCGSLLSGSGSFSSISENRVPGSMASTRRIIAASSGCSPSTRSRASRLMAADFTPGRPAMASSIQAAHPAQQVCTVALSHVFPLLAARFRSVGRANALQGNGKQSDSPCPKPQASSARRISAMRASSSMMVGSLAKKSLHPCQELPGCWGAESRPQAGSRASGPVCCFL